MAARKSYLDKIFRRRRYMSYPRTIDDFVDGNVISNKSVDLNAAVYQNFRTLLSRPNKCVDELEECIRARTGEVTRSSQLTSPIVKFCA